MLIALPGLVVIAVFLIASVGPALFLMRYIYKRDTVETEPSQLLVSLVLRGVLAALLSIVLETVAQKLLDLTPISPSSEIYVILTAFLVVAAVEEGTKYFLMHRKVWHHPSFNYRFDAIVYSAFVSLGFAAFENIQYVRSYGLTVAFPRAILAVPGHLGFSVLFGYFYGRAKIAEDQGNHAECKRNILMGYVSAVAMHGFYDACAMIGTGLSTLIFVVFVIVMYLVIIRLIRNESLTDEPIG